MTCDSGSRPTGRDVKQARGEARQSGAESASPNLSRETPMPDNKLTCTTDKLEMVLPPSSHSPAMHSARPIPIGYEELRERLLQTELKRPMRLGFNGMVAMDYEAGAQEVLVNPDGLEAADAITTLLTKLAEVERERDEYRRKLRSQQP